jgi:hypothetical protein
MDRRRVDRVDRSVVVDDELVDVGNGIRRSSIGGNTYLGANASRSPSISG